MSDDVTRLGISISATNTAGPSIEQVDAQIKLLTSQIRAAEQESGRYATQSANLAAQILKSVDPIRAQLAALEAQRTAMGGAQAAATSMAQAMDKAAVSFRSLQEGINASMGIDRTIDSAAASAKVLATSLSAMAEADEAVRTAAAEATAALERQAAAEAELLAIQKARIEASYLNRDADMAAAAARAEANYVNRDMDLASGHTRAQANYENRDRDLAYGSAFGAASYENRNRDMAAAQQRAEAELMNRNFDLQQRRGQQTYSGQYAEGQYMNRDRDLASRATGSEAQYMNRDFDAAARQRRQEAEQENAARNAKYDNDRRMAEYENRDRDIRARQQQNVPMTGMGVIAQHSQGEAAARAASDAIMKGKTEEEAMAAAARAGAEQLERQAMAARAVEAAERAAAAAGATAAEAAAAGAMAATRAMSMGGGAAGGRGATVMSREMGHLVAISDELARGNMRGVFSSIGAASRDAGLGVAQLATSFGGLVAIAGTVAILHSAEALGKWATESRAAASATGMSLQSYTEVAGALQMMGMRSEEADASLRHVAQTLSQAIADPASKAAEAYHNMGISQAQLASTGGDVSKLLDMLANAFARTADSGNKTANMTEIAGRGFEKLIPILQNGSEALEGLKQKAQELGITLTNEEATALESAGQHVRDLGDKIRGEGIQSMVAWAPVISKIADILSGLVTVIGKTTSAVGELVSAIGQFGGVAPLLSLIPGGTALTAGANLIDAFKGRGSPGAGVGAALGGNIGAGPKASVPALTDPISVMDQLREAEQKAGLAAAQSAQKSGASPRAARIQELQAEIAAMKQVGEEAQKTGKQTLQVNDAIMAKERELANAQISAAHAGAAGAKAAAHESYEAFAQAEKQKIMEAEGDTNKIIAIYDEWAQKANSVYKQHGSVVQEIENMKTRAVLQSQLAAVNSAAQVETALMKAQNAMSQGENIASGKYNPGGLSIGGQSGPKGQGGAEFAKEASQIEASSQKIIQAEMAIMESSSSTVKDQQAAALKIVEIVSQSKEQEIALYEKAAQQAAAASAKLLEPLTKMFDQLGSQFEGLSTSLVDALVGPKIDLIKQGLTTLKINERGTEVHQAIAKFAMDMVNDASKSLETAASQFAAQNLSKLFQIPITQGGGLGSLLSSGISKLTGIGGQASQQLNTAQFGVATTQLQTAATTLQTAAATLQSGAATQAGAAAGNATGAAGAVTISTPIVSAITGQSASISGALISTASSINATAVANTTLITGAIEGSATVEGTELAALNAKPSLLGFTYSQGGVVPSAAGGMVVGGGTGASLSVLHAQEMVLPAHLSRGIQGMIQNRSSNATMNYSPTINSQASRGRGGTGMTRAEMSQMMSQHGGAMLGEARNMARNGMRM